MNENTFLLLYWFFIHQENMSVKCIPPYTPLLYSKTGVCRGTEPFFFLFLLQNIDCGYSLEPPHSNVCKNKKNIKKFQLKIFNFHNFGKFILLHGPVFVMQTTPNTWRYVEWYIHFCLVNTKIHCWL